MQESIIKGVVLMTRYLLTRFLQMIMVVVVVSVLTFFMVNLLPGDIVLIVAGTDEVDQEMYDAIYYELGLDQPVTERYIKWAWNALHLDFGKSYTMNVPVFDAISARIPTTLYLSVLSMLISTPIGVVLGVICAVNRKTKIDTAITLTANTLNSLPSFWIGIVLLYIFCFKLKLLPTIGFDLPWKMPLGKHLKLLILPMTCLTLGGIAGMTRLTRTSMLEVIRQDFIRTARSKGLREKVVLYKHMLRNGILPIITVLGSRLAVLIGGSMFVENVFAIPGMGTLSVKCVQSKDIPMIQGIVLIMTTLLCVAYIITDIMYVVVDPRISLKSSAE